MTKCQKNTIFHIFPYGGENTKIPHFPKNPKIAKITKIGDFGDILEIAIFEVFGGSVENDILTDIGKTVKNGVFLTFCHIENTGFSKHCYSGKRGIWEIYSSFPLGENKQICYFWSYLIIQEDIFYSI